MRILKVTLICITALSLLNCNIVKPDKKEDNLLPLLVLSTVVGSGGSCTIGVIKGGRETTASANPVVLSTTEQSISYSKVPVVTHSIGVVQFKSAPVGSKVQFNTIDVADFDGSTGTASLPLVYTTSDCPVASSKQITSNASTYYTRSESDTTYTYTINTAGDYSFVLYQLEYPAKASTVKKL